MARKISLLDGVRALLLVLAAGGWLGLLVYKIHYLQHGGHQIDDSYMFYRYAEHLRHGLGFSWNLDGVHTYGMTTLLWAWLIVPFSMLPLPSAISLTLASWLTSGLALYLISAAIWKNAQSKWLQDRGLVLAVVTLSLLVVPMFDYGNVSGMETMLGFGMLAALIGLVLQQSRRKVQPEWIGLVAFLLFLSRPESLLVAVFLLGTSVFVLPGVTARSVLRAYAVLFAGVLLVGVCGKLYFGSWLPLSFYVKAKDGYVGYRARWYPFTYGLTYLKTCALYLVVIAAWATRRQRRLLLLMFVPLSVVMAYLCTVTQIMGFHDRYYLPYVPLLAIPAFLVLDARLVDEARLRDERPGGWGVSWQNAVALLVVIAFALGAFPRRLQVLAERRLERRVLAYRDIAYDVKPAPQLDYFDALNAFALEVAPYLPAGTVIASTEVGYLGAAAPQVNVLDLAGLNDRQIALHGFEPKAFLARRPDVIWLPHDDYTYQRGVLTTDPGFLANYEFYAGAFNYGVAVRKDSPARAVVEARMAAVWPKLYPGTTPEQSLVKRVMWAPGTSVPMVAPPKY